MLSFIQFAFCGKPLLIPAWLWPEGWDVGKDLKPPCRHTSPTSELPWGCALAAARCPGHRPHFSPGAPDSPAQRDKTDTPGEMTTQTSPPPAPQSSWLRAGLGLGKLHAASALPRGRLQPQLRRTPRHRSCARTSHTKKLFMRAFYVFPSHLPQASLRNASIPALQVQNKGRVAPGWHEPMPSRARFYTSTSTPCHEHTVWGTAWRYGHPQTCRYKPRLWGERQKPSRGSAPRSRGHSPSPNTARFPTACAQQSCHGGIQSQKRLCDPRGRGTVPSQPSVSQKAKVAKCFCSKSRFLVPVVKLAAPDISCTRFLLWAGGIVLKL